MLKFILPVQEAEDNMDIARDTLADFKESSDSQKKTLRTLIRALGGFIIICAAFGLLTLASRVRSVWICGTWPERCCVERWRFEGSDACSLCPHHHGTICLRYKSDAMDLDDLGT